MVSRSTATLNSLNGWPGDGAEAADDLLAIQVLDPLHVQRAPTKYCGPSSIVRNTAMSPVLPR